MRGAAELRGIEHVAAAPATRQRRVRRCRPKVVHHADELPRLGTDFSDPRVAHGSLRG